MTRSLMVALALGVGIACSDEMPSEESGDDDFGDASYCETLVGRLRDCGGLGPGRFACANYGDGAERCETQCVRDASCGDLAQLSCSYAGSVARCFQECIGLSPFRCDDGTLVAHFDYCDGNDDCANGEDELDCSVNTDYKCRNVDAFVDVTLFCDGREDCSDGSDEPPDCSVALVCDDGVPVAEFEVCNGFPWCIDGADEPADCAALSCD
jgi:hypothetical protein